MRSQRMAGEDGLALGQVWVASSMQDRMRGLLGRDGLPTGELMLLEPCGSIHTFGMRFTLDVLFLDASWRVVKVARAVRPGRMRFGGWKARRTLEAQTGWLDVDQWLGKRVVVSAL